METISASDHASASVGKGISENVEVHGSYIVECRGSDGSLKWTEEFDNLVVTVGKNSLLDTYFAGSGYTAAWYMGLIDNSGFSAVAAGDTMSSHAGWTESSAYAAANRPTVSSWNAAGSGSKATNTAVQFSINGTVTVNGVFMSTNSTKGGTTGTLYSAGSFGSPRACVNGDTLSVTWTASA